MNLLFIHLPRQISGERDPKGAVNTKVRIKSLFGNYVSVKTPLKILVAKQKICLRTAVQLNSALKLKWPL